MTPLPAVRVLTLVAALLGQLLTLQRALAQSPLAVAESAFSAGDNRRAIDLLRRITRRDDRDFRAWILLGRAELAGNPTSNLPRIRAINALRRATQLVPDSVGSWYWYARAGLALGGADGELIVKEGTEHALALDPSFEDAWDLWLLLYRNRSDRARIRRIIETHGARPELELRRARLYIEDELYDSANTLLDVLLQTDSTRPDWLARRAQSAFESGDTVVGAAFHDRALASAGRDASVLWEHAIGIAWPEEIRDWEGGIAPDSQSAWLRAFWARRDPDLFRDTNARLAEHFRRLRVARRRWPLMYPLLGASLRESSRAGQRQVSTSEEVFYQRCEARETPGGPTRAEDRARLPLDETLFPLVGAPEIRQQVPWPGALNLSREPGGGQVHIIANTFNRDLRDVDTTAVAIGYNRRTGLDDRGLTYLRMGEPRRVVIGSTNVMDEFCPIPDLERWQYDGVGTIRFFRPGAVSIMGGSQSSRRTGDLVMRPMTQAQFTATATALTTDQTSVPAPLVFGAWTAQFAGEAGRTELATVTTIGRAAVALVGDAPDVPRSISDSGIVVVEARPGSYDLLINAHAADSLGRLTRRIHIRDLSVALSDLVLGTTWSGVVTRSRALAHASRSLSFAPETTMRLYSEAYGLVARDGRWNYRATYTFWASDNPVRDFARADMPGAVTISHERDVLALGTAAAEWLDVGPGRLIPGRYVLRLEVTDLTTGRPLGRSQIAFAIRAAS